MILLDTNGGGVSGAADPMREEHAALNDGPAGRNDGAVYWQKAAS
jgi:hypothetical protein